MERWVCDATVLVGRIEHGDDQHRQWLRAVATPLIIEALHRAYLQAIEEAASVVDRCNQEGPYNAIGAATRIRELARTCEPC